MIRLLDSRRLTGANLLMQRPGAVLDIAVSEEDRSLLIAAWERHAKWLLHDLEWDGEQLATRCFDGGVSLAISAPVDGLYTATEVNEAAWEAARDWLEGGQRHLLQRAARQLRREYRDEERPRLQRLLDVAREKRVPVLLDEDVLTLGTGRFSESWDLFELPHPEDLNWPAYKAIPSALITGTNGKTTTVRLLASIAKAANTIAGVSSTDWLAIGDELLDRDDYAGPGGARLVLRDKRCELAILETARGGMLRRGLAVERADVAVITNIAADHLGDFGVATVDDLADVKWTVSKALDARGTLVINAEDALLTARMANTDAKIVMFALSRKSPAFAAHIKAGGVGFCVRRGRLTKISKTDEQPIVSVKKIPICYGGAAVHNVANCLAAAAVADALKLPPESIAAGLIALSNESNPGRANVFTINGCSVLVDFAHNPAGLEALVPMAKQLPAKRRALVIGQAGDRPDDDIKAFALAAADLKFQRIFIKRMDGHARGRGQGDVARLMKASFVEQGYAAKDISIVKTELDAARSALRWAKQGDLVLFLSHEHREKTQAFFQSRQNSSKDV